MLGDVNGATTTITLELELAGDWFTGRATDQTGAGRSFSGWLGLIAAIDELAQDGSVERIDCWSCIDLTSDKPTSDKNAHDPAEEER
jgi:hypothetical protein